MQIQNRFGLTGWLLLGLVVVLQYFSVVHNYSEPQAFMWDEKFHVTSAQKYLNNIFFMQAHPPLGKLLIAFGEKLIDSNPGELDSLYIGTDFQRDADRRISMRGYRLIPAMLAWALAPLSFIIFFLLVKDRLIAAILSFLVIFDTALSLILKGALLESPLIFATAVGSLSFLMIVRSGGDFGKVLLWPFVLGAAIGAAFTTKLTGLFLILFIPLIFFAFSGNWKKWLKAFLASSVGFIVVFVCVWQVHFYLGTKVEPRLSNEGYFAASPAYKEVLKSGEHLPISLFPAALKDSFKYMFAHHTTVGRLDLCSDKQRGSPWLLMPLGVRSTHFITAKAENGYGRYMYMQANPAVWWTSLSGIAIAVLLLIGSLLLDIRLKQRFLIVSFLVLYFSYMAALSRIGRAMFLHHYLPALFISFIILGLVIHELHSKGLLRGQTMQYVCMLLGSLIVLGNVFYNPLAAMEPLSEEQLKRRAFFPLWDLQCIGCEIENPIYSIKKCDAKADDH